MSEIDSPNYHEYIYSKKASGKNAVGRILLILLYVSFVVIFFLTCYITRVIPLFAVSPFFLWILVFFTWHYVSYDIYYEFAQGNIEFGKIKVTKRGRKKYPKIVVHVKEASFIAPYLEALERLSGVQKIYDFSECDKSENRIAMFFSKNGKTCAVVFEGNAKIAKLLCSFNDRTENLKGQTFHG